MYLALNVRYPAERTYRLCHIKMVVSENACIYSRAAIKLLSAILPVVRDPSPSLFFLILLGPTSHRRASDQWTWKTL